MKMLRMKIDYNQDKELHLGGNNNVYPLPGQYQSNTPYSQLDELSKASLLHDKGYLFGVRVDGENGPRRGTRQVAQYTSTLPLIIQDINNIESEVTITENDRDTNYVHKGWLISALQDNSPWTLSRIIRNNCQVNPRHRSITKHIIIPKLRIELLVKDLLPIAELEDAFSKALNLPTRFEKANAIYWVFENCLGLISLFKYLAEQSYLGLQSLSISATARISTQGGHPTMLQSEDNIREWLNKSVPPSQWEQVRVIKTTPITSILNNRLQSKLTNLHQSLTTCVPNILDTITPGGMSFDRSSYAFKTILKLAIFSDTHHIKSISIKYAAESSPVNYGGVQLRTVANFDLRYGEHVTNILLWKDNRGICGIQFGTSQGRTSQHFGSTGGSPQIMRSPGGCLSAFSGVNQDGMLRELQSIWIHDVQGLGLSGDRQFSRYLGGMGGRPFSDWSIVQHSDSICISSVRVKYWSLVDGIQISYSDQSGEGAPTSQSGKYHGGSGGKEGSFHLGPSEHIVAVTGRCKKYIDQICFTTNRGRKSPVFGGGGGDEFRCEAPRTRDGRATRLHYICGKSASLLDGIFFIWAPL
ncbi:Jacalin domain-containing protein [Rhizoctonia solani AG-1 IA]|uniref:Jacalin domain-containing protein n=1 Tax=Thanatephorus cucumeris (strain AG1-IA) TaxID=983506 RepID=L8WJ66_THACA|nr:Jacalin domain-containing protein [Rhizoctonia solani AG-1 IA]